MKTILALTLSIIAVLLAVITIDRLSPAFATHPILTIEAMKAFQIDSKVTLINESSTFPDGTRTAYVAGYVLVVDYTPVNTNQPPPFEYKGKPRIDYLVTWNGDDYKLMSRADLKKY